MTDIATVRDGLKVRLDTISSLRAFDTWPGQINPPAALVKPVSWEWETMDGTTKRYRFEVILAVQLGSLAISQDKLDAYVSDAGASSVEAALLGDTTLGGAVDDILRIGMHDYGTLEIAGVEYLGAVFDLEVMG